MTSTNAIKYTENYLSGPGRIQFYTRTYHPPNPRAILLFVHGFCEHTGRYTHIFPLYAQAGIAVLACDQRGFGRTALDEQGKLKPDVPGPYGRTSWHDQFEDIEFFLGKAREKFGKDKPVFLMGHSMGGGAVLGFCTRQQPPPSPSSVSQLTSVIVTSPLIELASPAPKLKRWVGEMAANLLPNMSVPAGTKAQDLSHDPAFNDAYENDPLIKGQGTLRGVSDMLNGGEHLLSANFKHWPRNLPLLVCHGSEDKVTSHKASEEFVGKIDAQDKTFTLYPGGYHELQNEPDGVKEKVTAQVIAFIDAHLHNQGEQAKL